jgi:adenine-specific DNA-methyltransferase
MPRRAASPRPAKGPKAYDHREQEALLRPDIGLQAQCRKKKDPATCRYDRSLDPQLSWDINADRVWEHLAGTLSEPFEGGARAQTAVKAIDDRGNELLVVKKLSEAEAAQ